MDCVKLDFTLSRFGENTMKRRGVREAPPFQRGAGSDYDLWLAVQTEPLAA